MDPALPKGVVTCNAGDFSIVITKAFEQKIQEIDITIGTGKNPKNDQEDAECVFVGTVSNAGKVADGDGAKVTQDAISGKDKVSDAKSLHGRVAENRAAPGSKGLWQEVKP